MSFRRKSGPKKTSFRAWAPVKRRCQRKVDPKCRRRVGPRRRCGGFVVPNNDSDDRSRLDGAKCPVRARPSSRDFLLLSPRLSIRLRRSRFLRQPGQHTTKMRTKMTAYHGMRNIRIALPYRKEIVKKFAQIAEWKLGDIGKQEQEQDQTDLPVAGRVYRGKKIGSFLRLVLATRQS